MLKTLDVSFNNITYVEDCAFCNTSLRTLNFAFNGMRSLNPDMVNYVSKYMLFMSRPSRAESSVNNFFKKKTNFPNLSILIVW